MQKEIENAAITDNDKAHIRVDAPVKVSEYIPDFIQTTIVDAMENIDKEIRQHEDAIKELSALYVAHANFLERYSPFETGNLSQDVSIDMSINPKASALGREGGKHG